MKSGSLRVKPIAKWFGESWRVAREKRQRTMADCLHSFSIREAVDIAQHVAV
jgi:hypothetical protein